MRSQQLELLDMDVNASKELVTRGAASEAALRERKRELLSMNQQVLGIHVVPGACATKQERGRAAYPGTEEQKA